MVSANSILKIRCSGLCCGCGACVAVCGKMAVAIVRNHGGYLVPEVDLDKCINCGSCLRVCPSSEDSIVGVLGNDPLVGDVRTGYIGHAVDVEYRIGGQSGGVASAIIRHLLEVDEIDGAIVNVFDATINRNVPRLITSPAEIPQSFGSYYAQSAVVDECLKHRSRRLAVVTLGCQSEALRSYFQLHPAARNNYFIIGLFCAGNYSGDYIDALIDEAGVNKGSVRAFRFRWKDRSVSQWPGKVLVATNQRQVILPSYVRTRIKKLYEVPRCRFCFDQLNVLADISIGDPWGIEKPNDSQGESVLLVRTERGREVICDAIKSRLLDLKELPVAQIVKGQTVHTRLARDLMAAERVADEFGLPKPYIPLGADLASDVDKVLKDIRTRILFSRKQMLSLTREDIIEERKMLRRKIIREARLRTVFSFPLRFVSKVVSTLRKGCM